MRQHAPATERNREPILEVLRQVFPARGQVLEVASGSGQHAVFMAAQEPGWRWQPSDPTEEALASIREWSLEAGLPNIAEPLRLDVCGEWPAARFDALFCANMLHIAPWAACHGLFSGAARVLVSGAPLVTYGPYRIDGLHTAPSNEQFEQWLIGRNPEWGVRDLGDVRAEAERSGFVLRQRIAMPANNFCLCFERV